MRRLTRTIEQADKLRVFLGTARLQVDGVVGFGLTRNRYWQIYSFVVTDVLQMSETTRLGTQLTLQLKVARPWTFLLHSFTQAGHQQYNGVKLYQLAFVMVVVMLVYSL